jgi:hypothetical protein
VGRWGPPKSDAGDCPSHGDRGARGLSRLADREFTATEGVGAETVQLAVIDLVGVGVVTRVETLRS